MANLISRIMGGESGEPYLREIMDNLHSSGPVNQGDLETLSYIKLYQPDIFAKHEGTILRLMGLYFKQRLPEEQDLRGLVSGVIGDGIAEHYGQSYTPVQVSMVDNITDNRLFSFSSATSTGKSHVFRELIRSQQGDMVIVVPSRALINEYFIRTTSIVSGMPVNVLVFPDIVNTAMADRNVFILTPERVKDLFRIKDQLRVSLVLFDEAQLADENGRRGIYFDSIVRRVNEHFSEARLLFAQPYISNPEAQFVRNGLDVDGLESKSRAYRYKNVGQLFTAVDNQRQYYHFAIDKGRLGERKVSLGYDPIERCLALGGSVLVYVPKSSIYSSSALEEMSHYISNLPLITDERAARLIDKIGELLGGSASEDTPDHSNLLSLLGRGIVIHHGSLPLQARFLVEEFIREGYCRICFATSTLYQGVNMPFDIVYIKRLEGSKPLLVKNLIGRAGRSTHDPVFDYGQVIVGASRMSELRHLLAAEETMSVESQIDVVNPDDDADLAEFKEAIKQGRLNDDYNLTDSQTERLGSEQVSARVVEIIDTLFSDERPMDVIYRSLDEDIQQHVIDNFKAIFRQHVHDRALSDGESAVIDNAVRIFIAQVSGRNLKSIVGGRFAYITRAKERRGLEAVREINANLYYSQIGRMRARYTMPAQDIPDKNLSAFGLFLPGTTVTAVDYDHVMYDTYDYIDKIWGFFLSDIFYAAFDLYSRHYNDVRARTMCNYIRYATIDETEIWLLRYGFSFEEIEWIKPIVLSIDETRIQFDDTSSLDEDQLDVIKRYLPSADNTTS